jgi:hypothetical protein
MKTLEAFNHGNGTLTVFITEQAHIEWLKSKGITTNLFIGNVLLHSEDRSKVYPTLTEAMSPAIARYIEIMENDYRDNIALSGELD